MRSNPVPTLFFILQLKNILRSNLKFSTPYGRLTDLKSYLCLLSVSFILLGEKIISVENILFSYQVWQQKISG